MMRKSDFIPAIVIAFLWISLASAQRSSYSAPLLKGDTLYLIYPMRDSIIHIDLGKRARNFVLYLKITNTTHNELLLLPKECVGYDDVHDIRPNLANPSAYDSYHDNIVPVLPQKRGVVRCDFFFGDRRQLTWYSGLRLGKRLYYLTLTAVSTGVPR